MKLKNGIYLLISLLLWGMGGYAQKLSPVVTASQGSSSAVNGYQLQWTLGETIIPTLGSGNSILTQGFQQPELQVWTGPVSGPVCSGVAVYIPFKASGITSSTNVWTAELSDRNGSFSNPVSIGSGSGNINGILIGNIPAGTPSGDNYRIRVNSSLPSFRGLDNGQSLKVVQVKAAIEASFALNNGVSPNTVYLGYGPASHITLQADGFGGEGDYTYQWSTGQTGKSITVSPGVPTTYKVTVHDRDGCASAVASMTINVVDVRCGAGNKGVIVCRERRGEYTADCVDQSKVEDLLERGATLGSCNSTVEGSNPELTAKLAEVKLSAMVNPNPSLGFTPFRLTVTTVKTDIISMRVVDEFGRMVEARNNLPGNTTIQFGGNYAQGIYFAEILQGKEKVILRLMKMNE